MARNITQLTLSSLTLALSLTGCGGRDLTLGTRDDGVNLDDENGTEPDADGVGETGTGTGSGGGEPAAGGGEPSDSTISEPGSMGPAEAEDSSGSGGGAPAAGTVALAGAGPCTELVGGITTDISPDGEVVISRELGGTVDGDGTTTVYRRDGSMTVIAPDGTETTTQDAMIATAEDGTQTLYFSDGTVMTIQPDETVLANGETPRGEVWSVESWSVESGPSGSTGTGTAPTEVPCSGTSGGGTMEPSGGMDVDPAPEDAFLRMCSANGDGTYSYREADGTVTTVSRPEPLSDGSISMEEASSPCADVWAAEDADETGSATMGVAGSGSGTATGGATGAATMDPEPEE